MRTEEILDLSDPFLPADVRPDAIRLAQESAGIGDRLYNEGRFTEAMGRYRQSLRLCPRDAAYHYKLGMAAWSAHHDKAAERHLEEAVRLAPHHPKINHAVAQWYLGRGFIDAALRHSARAIQAAGTEPEIIVGRAAVLDWAGEAQTALDLIEPLIAAGVESPSLAALYGKLAARHGRERQALEMVRRLLNSASLANPQRITLSYSAAALLEQVGEYDQAFEHARQANALQRRPYDARQNSQRIERYIRYFSGEKMAALPRASAASRRPVFIVGMPRSGTSLIEQILATHPQVHGVGELEAISRIVYDAGSSHNAYPESLDAWSVPVADQFAARYLSVLQAHSPTATHVTDKMPTNFRYLGLIELLFPSCHVIHCARDPRDTCVSCYFTNFAFGAEYSNDLADLGCFYRDYRRMMDHWESVLKVPLLQVQYEQVVADLEGQTRRMLDFLGLPWDRRCLSFHENERRVTTASGQQVRRPLYASSVGRWRRYERQLGDLLAALDQR